jgi:hypothetical protein
MKDTESGEKTELQQEDGKETSTIQINVKDFIIGVTALILTILLLWRILT